MRHSPSRLTNRTGPRSFRARTLLKPPRPDSLPSALWRFVQKVPPRSGPAAGWYAGPSGCGDYRISAVRCTRIDAVGRRRAGSADDQHCCGSWWRVLDSEGYLCSDFTQRRDYRLRGSSCIRQRFNAREHRRDSRTGRVLDRWRQGRDLRPGATHRSYVEAS
jgi:hypothetical protein